MKDRVFRISLEKVTALITFITTLTIFPLYFFTDDLRYGFIGYLFTVHFLDSISHHKIAIS